MRKLLLGFVLLQHLSVFAQKPVGYSSAEIYQQIKKLQVLGSVLYIAAHPDDENTRLLAYLARERQYRTGYLSLTRGDGGQNLIGDEQGVELGLIRTQELLAARRVDGAEQFFTRAYDFGFSKTADETLRIWDKQKVLADVVWVIRKFRPDVIITRFPGDARAGHGHHWSSALLANEAFKLAGDPNAFPEQLKMGVSVWQAKRIFWNTFNFGGNNTTSDNQLKIDVGVYNPVTGESYGEVASESRSQHKSQGFGVPRGRGQSYEYFVLTGGEPAVNDIMDGVNTTWSREANGTGIAEKVQRILSQFEVQSPEKSVPALLDIYQQLQQQPDSYWKNQKLKELVQLIEVASGLFLEATSSQGEVVVGEQLRTQVWGLDRTGVQVQIQRLRFADKDSVVNQTLGANRNWQFTRTATVTQQYQSTQPYWLQKLLNKGMFQIDDQQLIGDAENVSLNSVVFELSINGVPMRITKPIRYKFTDPVKGELYQPLYIKPAVEISFKSDAYLVNGKMPQLQLNIVSNSNSAIDGVQLTLAAGKSEQLVTLGSLKAGEQRSITVTLDKQLAAEPMLAASVLWPNNLSNQKGRTIAYDHIPLIYYTQPAQTRLSKVEMVTKGKKIGYIAGAGDKLPQALEQMGYEVKVLHEDDFSPSVLNGLDAIITGVRAYNIHEYLSAKYDVLMAYVQQGGNLIVQYNTNNQIGPVKAKIGPYPFTITRTRVTEEDAAVNFLLPEHPVLNTPNKITAKDFEGWIQERSIYHAEGIDPAFAAPLGMNDQGEKENNGSLIIASYGKGNFVYTGLVFFRELPAGVPGAYRLMANLIALPKNK